MSYLSKEEIFNSNDKKREDVEIPEWPKDGVPGKVRVRNMDAYERDEFESSMFRQNKEGDTERNLANMRAKLVSLTVVDPETDERVFSLEDAEWLGRKSASAIDRIFAVAQRLSGITRADRAALVKNSEKGQNEGSALD